MTRGTEDKGPQQMWPLLAGSFQLNGDNNSKKVGCIGLRETWGKWNSGEMIVGLFLCV